MELIDIFTLLSVVLVSAELRNIFSNWKSKRLRLNLVEAAREAKRCSNEIPRFGDGRPSSETIKAETQQAYQDALKKLKIARDKDWAYNGYPADKLKDMLINEGLWHYKEGVTW